MVLKYEEELSEVVEVCHAETSAFMVCRKKDLTDNEYDKIRSCEEMNNAIISEMFDVFDMVYIDNIKKEALVFVVQPSSLGILWNTWAYGFYYSEDGSPQSVLTDITVIEESENEMTGEGAIVGFGECRYQTERIRDNWWFFESELEEGFIERTIRINRNKKYIY